MDIAAWLRQLGLERYEPVFRQNELDWDVLPELTDAELEKLGLPLGPRKKLLKAIAALPAQPGPLGGAEPSSEATPHDAERRQLTIMFVDLAGSTALAARLDAEDLREVIRRYQNVVAGEVARFDGHVAKFMGDGVLVYFGYPTAHEDDAERAVRAARAILTAMDEEPVAGERLQVRIGVATGEVVVGDLVGEGKAQEEAVIGETPNLAARLQQVAPPGSVVIAPATRNLLGSLFELEDLGAQVLKGIATPMRCWRVVGEQPVDSRFEAARGGRLSRFVGREQELALLEERWFRAQEGEGQAVLLTGEAGIGKSRLTRALMDRLAGGAHTRLRYQCSPYHVNTALHPFIAQIERAAGFAPGDGAEAKRAKLEALLRQATDDPGGAMAVIGSLLSLPATEDMAEREPDPQRRKQLTFGALLEQLAGLAARQPVLVIFEDAHWADPTSLELLEEMVDRVQGARVLAVITGRPEFRPAWPGHAHVTMLTLNRLGRRHGAEIVTELTGGKLLPEAVMDQIVARTDGVPLFVEELTKTVLESGLLHDAGDRFELTDELPAPAIPSTLQDSLMARLDRLAPVKEVAQFGAAIGREFSYRLLAKVASLDERGLGEALDRLVGAELLFRRGSPPDATYVFKHALVQDTAYGTLLRAKRQAIHQRIASVLLADTPERAETEPELLAHHYTGAGLPERAVPCWLRAGQQAAERSADVEAREHLQKALRLLEALPASPERDRWELQALIALGPVLTNLKSSASPEVRATYARARELCDHTGEAGKRFPALWGLWIHHNMAGELDTALDLAHEALALAESLGNADFLIQAHHATWTSHQGRANYAAVVEHADRGLAFYDVERHRMHAFTYGGHDPGLCAALQSAIASWFLGYPDQAVERAERALQLAPVVAHGFSTAQTLAFAATLRLLRREPDQAVRFLDELMPFCEEHRLTLWEANGMILRGWALAEMGHAREALDGFREGIEQRIAAGSRLRLPLQLAARAEALARAGEVDAAEAVVAEALAEMERTGERTWESFIHWICGRVIAARPQADLERAAGCFQTAREIARRQGAKSMELRAATSLAGLWLEQGRRKDARKLLAPIHEWFTEGFDTADLEEAKSLLEELS